MNTGLLIAGVIVAIIGLFALNYSVVVEDEAFGGLIKDRDIEKPYNYLGIPLIVIGIILVVAGIAVDYNKKVMHSS